MANGNAVINLSDIADRDRFVLRVPQSCLGEGVGKQTAYTSIGAPNREFADTLTRTVVRYR